jgi:acyl-CoA synthetase (AMP-forming)/AMP-acid ligase II
MDNYISIPAMALASAKKWGPKTAIVDGDASLTYQALAEMMIDVAKSLITLGIKPGDRVAIWAPNIISWIPAALGIQAAGGWVVPMNTRLKSDEAIYILEKTQAAMLFTVDEFLGVNYKAMLVEARPELSALQNTVLLPPSGSIDTEAWQQFLTMGEAIESQQVYDRIASIQPYDVSDIIFTSGTTSAPKGVMLTHKGSLGTYDIFNRDFGLDSASRYMITTPFFHCFGYKCGWMMAMMNGATSYPIAVFDGRKSLELIANEGITHMGGSPTMFDAMLNDPELERFNLDTLDTCVISATTIPEQIVHRVRNELTIAHTFTGYGLTENHGFVSLTRANDTAEVVATTAGRIIPELDFRVVDDNGNPVPNGKDGELLVRGFMLMKGYYQDDEATAKAVVDGWLHTGDVVRVDDNGYLKITDRKKDIYIMGGFNVAPAEVENALLAMEGIAQIAIVAAPDKKFGEVGAAFIIRTPGSDICAADVITYAREHLANYKVPRYVEFVDAYPMNAMGKVLKRDLKAIIEKKLLAMS